MGNGLAKAPHPLLFEKIDARKGSDDVPSPTLDHSGRSWRLRSRGIGAKLAALDTGDGLADGHAKADPSVKAPIAEALHCPLAFEGTHLLKELEIAQVAHHYCKPMGEDLVAQCLLYDGTGPNARLIGVEYLVSAEIYSKMPADEQVYWHDHKYEVDAGYIKSLTQTGDEEKQTLAKAGRLAARSSHLVDRQDLSHGAGTVVLGGDGGRAVCAGSQGWDGLGAGLCAEERGE